MLRTLYTCISKRMKRFVTKFVCFSVLVLGLAWGLDYVLCLGQARVGGYPQQPWAEIRAGGLDADVIVMGNSRGLEHFDCAVLDSVTGLNWYNLGIGGYSINVELMKYHCYLAHNAKPTCVIMQVDWMTMAMNATIVHDHQSEQFFPLIYDKSIRKDLADVGYTWKELYLPLSRWIGYQTHIKRSIFALAGKRYPDIPCYKGFAADPDPWNPSRLEIKDSIVTKMDTAAMVLFDEFLAECQSDSMKVIMVYSPMYGLAYQMQLHNAEIETYFQSLSEKYSIPYWNYNDGNPLWADSTLFNAGVHLTPNGTKVFSRMFGEEVVELYKEVVEK